MTLRGPKTGLLVASVPMILWALYIGVEWNVAPRLCASPGWLNGISATVLLGSALAVLVGGRLLGRADGNAAESAALGRESAAKLGTLFTVGVALAWLLAAFWCG